MLAETRGHFMSMEIPYAKRRFCQRERQESTQSNLDGQAGKSEKTETGRLV